MENKQFGRRVSLLLVEGEKALDLSAMHFRFRSQQSDEESPDNCAIRVWNLAEDTVKKIRGEFSKVVLQAGYDGSAFGVIFSGTVKQYRIGKEPDGINSYLDILAADGDIAYNWSMVNQTLAAGSTRTERLAAAIKAMNPNGVTAGKNLIPPTGGVLPRGKVLFGLARAALRAESNAAGATWTITGGKVNIVPLEDYLPGEAVVLTAETGLIGRAEQTEAGLRARVLINPKIVVGGLVKIDNKSINQTVAARGSEIEGAQLAYDRYAGVQMLATITADGLYRVYVAEHTGDTRGVEYYTDLICLAVDPVTMKVKPYG
jgi:hypothetical protein